jgi:RNA polymerase sigma factor (sigma-70 family)
VAAVTTPGTTKERPAGGGPAYVRHESFSRPDAEARYGPAGAHAGEYLASHMPDEVTRDTARRMHYAAYRARSEADARRRRQWQNTYFALRDRVVLGNRKLVYRAVRRWMPPSAFAEDMAGDCQVVLIQAVAAYNPWLGIRFSTYAFTCLMRALSRLSQRHGADRLSRSVPLEALPEGEPRDLFGEETHGPGLDRIDEYLRDGNDLLSFREKRVLVRRFRLDEQARAGTLEQVGRELGLSKERVRQVQANALGKLRKALLEETPSS